MRMKKAAGVMSAVFICLTCPFYSIAYLISDFLPLASTDLIGTLKATPGGDGPMPARGAGAFS